jgi:MFS family permease
MTPTLRRALFGSSLGTMFEWYDFFLYALLTPIFAKQFFSGLPESTAILFALLTFSVGFIVRPFGGLIFGHLGDRKGRKISFLITIIIMGAATFAVGLLPTYETAGIIAPVLLIVCRLLQGLALGGEYGGAAIFVAEHAPENKRGFFTSFIQSSALVALLMSLMVIVGVRHYLGEAEFNAWGWRIPFLLSLALLALSIWIRLRMQESPVFQQMREEGRLAKRPISDLFTQKANLKRLAFTVFGIVAGQAIVAYTSQFYAIIFMTQSLRMDLPTAYGAMSIALIIGTPFLIFCGWLSDKIGWRPLFISGCLLAALTYIPLFQGIISTANPALSEAQSQNTVIIQANPQTCNTQFQLVGSIKALSLCDDARQILTRRAIAYTLQPSSGEDLTLSMGTKTISFVAADLGKPFQGKFNAVLESAGFPAKPAPEKTQFWQLTGILTFLLLLVGLTYGPTAGALVSTFPPSIRYTGVSFAYHIGNGWFGGFFPPTAFAISAAYGHPIAGIGYAVIVAALCALICLIAGNKQSTEK